MAVQRARANAMSFLLAPSFNQCIIAVVLASIPDSSSGLLHTGSNILGSILQNCPKWLFSVLGSIPRTNMRSAPDPECPTPVQEFDK